MLLKKDELYKVHLGDTIPHLAEMPDQCVHFCVYSPPFPSVYSYSGKTTDIGNSENLKGDGKIHLSFFYRQLKRVVKPGRVVLVHVQQIPRMKRTGGTGLFDFRGLNIRLGERAGLIYEYDWLISKNPQSQAIRNRVRELQFVGLRADRAKSRGCLCDYMIKFLVPGENKTPINSKGQVTEDDWIAWAEGAWLDIRETDTLNVKEGREETDTRHVCPLQLGLLERSIRLYSNPSEIVFDPFSGLASTGYEAIRLGRRYYGCELKKKYWEAGNKNLKRAETASGKSRGFFHSKPSSNGHNGSTGNRDKSSGRRFELIED